MTLIKRYGRSDIIIPALIGISSFLNGGEHFAVKYLLPVIAALFCLFGKERRADVPRLIVMGAAMIFFVRTLAGGDLNTDTLYFLIFTALLLYITTLTPEKKLIVNGVILTASVHAMVIIFSFGITGDFRQASTFVNANWAAVWLVTGLYFLLVHWKGKPPVIRGGAGLLLLAGIIVTLSRTGFLLLFLLAFLLARKAGRKARFLIAALLLAALLFLSVRILRDLKDPLAFSRGRIYTAAAEMFSEKPLFGYGIAVVDDRLPGFSLGEDRVYSNYSVSPRMAHSIYLESLLSFGIIGTLLLGAGIIPMLKKSALQAPFVLLLLAGLFNNIEKSFSLLLLGALFLAVRKKESTESRRGVSFTGKRALIPVFAVTYLLILSVTAHFFFLTGDRAMKENRTFDSFRSFYRAYRILPLDPYYAEWAVRSLLATDKVQWDVKLSLCEEILTQAVSRNNSSPGLFYLKGVYYNAILRSDHFQAFKPEVLKRALDAVGKAISLNPKKADYYYLDMVLWSYTGHEAAVKEAFEKLTALEPYYLNAYLLMMEKTTDETLKRVCAEKAAEIRSLKPVQALNSYEREIMGRGRP